MKANLIRIKRITEGVLEPLSIGEQSGVVEEVKLAERLSSLKGARIALYNNRKPFAALALPVVQRFLEKQGAAEVFTCWATMSNRPTDETLAKAAGADAVVLAAAD